MEQPDLVIWAILMEVRTPIATTDFVCKVIQIPIWFQTKVVVDVKMDIIAQEACTGLMEEACSYSLLYVRYCA